MRKTRLGVYSSSSDTANWKFLQSSGDGPAGRFGSQGATTTPVNTHKNHLRQDDPMILGRTSWIADELIGIRTLEQRLCRKLKSGRPQNRHYLLSNIQDLNWRVELLDRALDECVAIGDQAVPLASLHK